MSLGYLWNSPKLVVLPFKINFSIPPCPTFPTPSPPATPPLSPSSILTVTVPHFSVSISLFCYKSKVYSPSVRKNFYNTLLIPLHQIGWLVVTCHGFWHYHTVECYPPWVSLEQGCATCSPWAKCGPRTNFDLNNFWPLYVLLFDHTLHLT